MLTDRAQASVDGIVVWLRVGLYVFVGYALSRHFAWEDAVAGTFVITQTLRAVAQRQCKAGDP